MTAEVFLDTNIVVYAVDLAHESAKKREVARRVLRAGNFVISTQVAQEFFVTATRKLEKPLSIAVAARWVEQLCRVGCLGVDASLVKLAIAHSQKSKLSYWDAAIIAAAEMAGARRVLSEDLNSGQRYGLVTVENPFR